MTKVKKRPNRARVRKRTDHPTDLFFCLVLSPLENKVIKKGLKKELESESVSGSLWFSEQQRAKIRFRAGCELAKRYAKRQ